MRFLLEALLFVTAAIAAHLEILATYKDGNGGRKAISFGRNTISEAALTAIHANIRTWSGDRYTSELSEDGSVVTVHNVRMVGSYSAATAVAHSIRQVINRHT